MLRATVIVAICAGMSFTGCRPSVEARLIGEWEIPMIAEGTCIFALRRDIRWRCS
jgi:hypothetical protein